MHRTVVLRAITWAVPILIACIPSQIDAQDPQTADRPATAKTALLGLIESGRKAPVDARIDLRKIGQNELKGETYARAYLDAVGGAGTSLIEEELPERLAMIKVKYDLARRESSGASWRGGQPRASVLTVGAKPGAIEVALSRPGRITGAPPVRALLDATADRVLDTAAADWIEPGRTGAQLAMFAKIQPPAKLDQVSATAYLDQADEALGGGLKRSIQEAKLGSRSAVEDAALVASVQAEIAKPRNPSRPRPNPKSAGTAIRDCVQLRQLAREATEREVACVEGTQAALDDIKEALFNNMPAEQRLAWLERGKFVPRGEGSKEDKDKLLKEAKQEARREKLLNSVGDYLETGGKVVDFAHKVGVPKDVIQVATVGLKIGSAAKNFASDLARGNVVGAVLGAADFLGDLIFGGGPDTATLRHEEIMKQLGVMDQKLDAILAGQEEILKGIDRIRDDIAKLGQQVAENHAKVMEKLEMIHQDVLYNQAILVEILEKDFRILGEFRHIDSLPDHDAKRAWFRLNVDLYLDCKRALSQIRVSEDFPKISQYFVLRVNPAPDTANGSPELRAYLGNVVGPVNAAVRNEFAGDLPRALSALARPSLSVAELSQKAATWRELPPFEPGEFPVNQFGEFLNFRAVRTYTNLVSNYVAYTFLVDFDRTPLALYTSSQLRDPAAFSDVQTKTDQAIRHLKDPLLLVNLALAQRSALGGDLLLPGLAEALEKPGVPTSDLVGLLKNNPLLARNAVAYWTTRRLAANGGNSTSYRFAIESEDKFYLSTLAATDSRLPEFKKIRGEQMEGNRVVEKEFWHLSLGDLSIPMPSPSDFDNGILYPSDELVELHQIRERLIDEIASYRLRETLSRRENLALSLLILAP